MDKNNYFETRALNTIDKINAILETLPYFVQDFFVGIENRTSPLTRLNYAYDLRVFFNYLSKRRYQGKAIIDITLKDIERLEVSEIEMYLSYLSRYTINGKQESCTERGKARKLASLRSFYKYFFNKGYIVANTASKVSMPKLHEKEIIRLESNGKVNEIAKILNIVDSGSGLTEKQLEFHLKTRLRDVAIITLFLGTGIRISELVGINIDDIDYRTNSFVVTRKGGNRAILYFNDEVKSALQDYVVYRNTALHPPEDEKALFLSLQNKRISTRMVQELVKKYAKLASPLKKITPHKLRSTFGTHLYSETGDIYMVADCLGHKDINTTKRHYAAISEDVRKIASRKVKLRDDKDDRD